MIEAAVIKWIQGHEGYRGVVYFDSLEKPTCGWGHYLAVGSKVPLAASEAFFKQDFKQAKDDLKALIETYSLPNLGPVRKAVLLGMLFQMGLGRVKKFKKMIVALMDKNWDKAADEMLDSRWAKQTPKRAEEAAQMMRTGSIK